MSAHDTVLDLLADIRFELVASIDTNMQLVARAERISQCVAEGHKLTDVMDEDQLIVTDLHDSLAMLQDLAGQLRRAQAKALHDEGWTMEQIAAKFRVTRQRVSALLNDARTPL